jgi:hypothetical protein
VYGAKNAVPAKRGDDNPSARLAIPDEREWQYSITRRESLESTTNVTIVVSKLIAERRETTVAWRWLGHRLCPKA